MLQLLCQYAKRENLRLCLGFIGRSTVSEDTRNGRNLRTPAAIVFAFALELELHTDLL